MRRYIYLCESGVISILAKRKPSLKSEPRSGTWVVREWKDGEWEMPCFPEITWRLLSRCQYLCSTPK